MNVEEREGGDITAQHMVTEAIEPQPSLIGRHFKDATVFVTGATGFLGRLLVEKLLHSCPDVLRVYVLLRDRPGSTCEDRFRSFFNCELFDRLRRENVGVLQKVSMMRGDCELPALGLSGTDQNVVLREVNCIFHCASTTRPDERLSKATLTNIGATKELVSLAKKMRDLRSFVHASTVFSFCTMTKIWENFYEMSMTGDELLTALATLKEDVLNATAPTLLGPWPNTYTFTKALAEDVIRREGANLPLAIVRPSIVIGTAKKPVAGWVQNYNGANALIVGVALGLVCTLQCNVNNFVDMVPADSVVNCMMAAAWDVAMQKGSNLNSEVLKDDDETLIYNCVSTPINPIRWGTCIDLLTAHFRKIPPVDRSWSLIFFPSSSRSAHLLLRYLLHLVPAVLLDAFGYCAGRNFGFLKKYAKIEKFLNEVGYFTSREWHFRDGNTQRLWEKLNNEDRRLFDFDMAALDWHLYFHTYVRGLRVYLLNDPLETVPVARVRCQKLKRRNRLVLTVIGFVTFVLLFKLFYSS